MDPVTWNRCAPWIQDALDHGDPLDSLEIVRSRIDDDTARLWESTHAAIVSELVRPDEMHIWLAGGESLAAIEDLLAYVEDHARSCGIRRISVIGRRGWERTSLARTRKYVPVATLYLKDLT